MSIVPDLKEKLEYLFVHYPEVPEFTHPYVKPADPENTQDQQRAQDELSKLRARNLEPQPCREIRNQSQLASALSLKSKTSISNWVSEETASPPNYVPAEHIERMCEIYDLDEGDLLEKDFNDFREIVELIIENKRPTWQGFMDRLKVADQEITMVRNWAGEYLDIGEDIPQHQLLGARYRLGERFRLHVSGLPHQYVTLLIDQPSGRQILCPTSSNLNNQLDAQGRLALPGDPERSFRTKAPEGQHHWIAIFSEQRLKIPGTAYDTQRTPRHKGITRMIRQLRELDKNTWSACKMPFYTVAD